MERITRLGQLPDWFDLKKYKDMSANDVHLWFINIQNCLVGMGKEVDLYRWLTWEDYKCLYKSTPIDPRKIGGDNFITVDSLKGWAVNNKKLLEDEQYVDEDGYRGFAYACVNLTAPDTQIIADFERWLVEVRKRKDYPFDYLEYPKEGRLKALRDNMVLPYLHLMFWSLGNKLAINQQVLADALFPPESMVLGKEFSALDKLRKRTIPLSRDFYQFDYDEGCVLVNSDIRSWLYAETNMPE